MKPLNRDEAIEKLRVVKHRLREALDRFYNHDDLSLEQVALQAQVLNLATAIRVIVHDAGKGSMSLLGQIDPDYWSKLIHFSPLKPPRTLPSGEQAMSVVIPLNVSLGANKTVFTRYKGYKNLNEKVPLKDWWSEIRWDSGTNQLSNKDIILAIVNKEGGAHVDGDTPSKYKSAKNQGQIVVAGRPVNDVVRLGSLSTRSMPMASSGCLLSRALCPILGKIGSMAFAVSTCLLARVPPCLADRKTPDHAVAAAAARLSALWERIRDHGRRSGRLRSW